MTLGEPASGETISDLRRDLDETKQDKLHLREHNQDLKLQVATLKEELRLALARPRAPVLEKEVKIDLSSSSFGPKDAAAESASILGRHQHRSVTEEVESSPEPAQQAVLIKASSSLAHADSDYEHKRKRSPSLHVADYASKTVPGKPEEEGLYAKRDVSTAAPSVSDREFKRKKIDAAPGPSALVAKRRTPLGFYLSEKGKTTLEAAAAGSSDSQALENRRRTIPIQQDDAFILPELTASTYLKGHPRFCIKPKPMRLHVYRQLLGGRFGGSHVRHVQNVHADKNPSGNVPREFTFPLHTIHPLMPLLPGENGLLIGSRYHDLKAPIASLFRRHLDLVDPLWQHLGEYTFTIVGKMSPEVFRSQNESQGWATIIIRGIMNNFIVVVRSRIALRARGNQAPDSAQVQQEVKAIRAGYGLPISVEDVTTAYSRGDEAVDITLLRCVGCDWKLANAIEAAHASCGGGSKLTVKRRNGAGRKSKNTAGASASLSSGGPSSRPQRSGRSTWDAFKGQRVHPKDGAGSIGDTMEESDGELSYTSVSDESDDEYDEVDALLHA